MKRSLIAFVLFGAILLFSSLRTASPISGSINAETPLQQVLLSLGGEPLDHQVNFDLPGVSAAAGRQLVHDGKAVEPNGGETARQSRHFVCTACHNTQREDPDLSVSDPQARLEYVAANQMPFLQGTSLYGAVNRTHFYNGDYEKKYGELVAPARNDIREAIQLCAVECAQGRPLDEWEIESILAYLWDIQLTLGDLQLSEKEWEEVRTAVSANEPAPATREMLHSKYLRASPATFVVPPENRRKGYPDVVEGKPENGQLIYELSCLHCHEGQRYAFFELTDDVTSFKYLKKHFPKYTRYSCYQVIRYGTSPMPGKRAYMPNYTLEKMSNQQVEDLRAYITQEAKG